MQLGERGLCRERNMRIDVGLGEESTVLEEVKETEKEHIVNIV